MPQIRNSCLFAVAWAVMALVGCSKGVDPTTLLGARPTAVPTVIVPGTPGVTLHFTRKGDSLFAVIHVWVEDLGATANLKTLMTYSGVGTYDCVLPGPCSFEAVRWPLFWPLSNNGAYTDGNSSASVGFSSDTVITKFWDWKDRSGSLVPDGSYALRVEVSSYYYDPSNSNAAGEAHVWVLKNGSSGSSIGSVDRGNQIVSLSATWEP